MPKGKEIKKKKQGCGSLQTEHDPRSELVRVTVTLVIVTVVGAATDAYTAGTTSQACWHFTNTLNFTRANEAAAITIPRGWVANLGLSTMLPLLRDNVNTVLTFVRAQRFGIKIPSGGHKLKAAWSRSVSGVCGRNVWYFPVCLCSDTCTQWTGFSCHVLSQVLLRKVSSWGFLPTRQQSTL